MNLNPAIRILAFLLLPLTGMGIHSGDHADHQAQYLFQLTNTNIVLTVQLDHHEVEHLATTKTDAIASPFQISGYILNHLHCAIDGKPMTFEFMRSETSRSHTEFVFYAHRPELPIRQVHLNLNAFLSVSKDFVNLVNFDLGGDFRSYTMNKDRQEISLQL